MFEFLSRRLCQDTSNSAGPDNSATNGALDGAVFQNFLSLAAVVLLWLQWRKATEADFSSQYTTYSRRTSYGGDEEEGSSSPV